MKLNKKGSFSTGGVIGLIIGVLILVLIAIALLPVIKNAITLSISNWSASEYALLSLIPLLLIVVVLMAVVKGGGLTK